MARLTFNQQQAMTIRAFEQKLGAARTSKQRKVISGKLNLLRQGVGIQDINLLIQLNRENRAAGLTNLKRFGPTGARQRGGTAVSPQQFQLFLLDEARNRKQNQAISTRNTKIASIRSSRTPIGPTGARKSNRYGDLVSRREQLRLQQLDRAAEIKKIKDPEQRLVAEKDDLPLFKTRADKIDVDLTRFAEFRQQDLAEQVRPIDIGRGIGGIKRARQKFSTRKQERLAKIKAIKDPIKREATLEQEEIIVGATEQELAATEKIVKRNTQQSFESRNIGKPATRSGPRAPIANVPVPRARNTRLGVARAPRGNNFDRAFSGTNNFGKISKNVNKVFTKKERSLF